MKHNLFRSSQAFTLIEIMVVIVILGVLAGLIVPKIMGRPDDAKILKAKMTIESLETALKLYKLDNGTYPTTEQGLEALIHRPTTDPQPTKWRQGGYIEKGRVPTDPWDNTFAYLSPGTRGDYDIICYGADGVTGGDGMNGDITNWDIE